MYFPLWDKKAGFVPALGLIFGLSACATVPSAEQGSGRVALFDDTISLSAPSGYCLDTASSQTDAQTPVLIFASCQGLGFDSAKPPSVRGILTATVQPKGAEGVHDLTSMDDFFRSDRGGRLIARRMNNPVEIHDSGNARTGYYWLLAEETQETDPGLSPWVWLGMTTISGHAAALKFYPASGFEGNEATSEQIFHQFMRRNTRK